MARRTGRRPGSPDTRQAILDAAREAFAERGFDGATIRTIATSAGVDPALVHHYFGTKDQLFLAAMNSPIDPRKLIPQIVSGGPEMIGERLVRTVLGMFDSPVGVVAVGLLRSAVTNELSARLLREFVTTQVLRRVFHHLELDPAEKPLRASLVASQVAGMAMMRYVIKLEPIASAPLEAIVAAIGPTVQRYLTGDLSEAFARLD